MDFEHKILTFAVAIKDTYRNEEDREGLALPKLELSGENFTEDFTAMLYALQFLYCEITGNNTIDIITFTHLLNGLAVQKYIEARGCKLEENYQEQEESSDE